MEHRKAFTIPPFLLSSNGPTNYCLSKRRNPSWPQKELGVSFPFHTKAIRVLLFRSATSNLHYHTSAFIHGFDTQQWHTYNQTQIWHKSSPKHTHIKLACLRTCRAPQHSGLDSPSSESSMPWRCRTKVSKHNTKHRLHVPYLDAGDRPKYWAWSGTIKPLAGRKCGRRRGIGTPIRTTVAWRMLL